MSTESLLRLFLLQVLGLFAVVAATGQTPCAPYMSVSLANGTRANDGSVLFDGLSFPPESQFELNGELRGCPCLLRNCIRRCCESGKVLKSFKCQEPKQNNSTYEFGVPQLPDEIFHPEIKDYEEHFYILYEHTCMTGRFYSHDLENFTHFISPNGTLEIKKKKTNEFMRSVPNDRYCVTYLDQLRIETFAVCRTEEEVHKKQVETVILWIYFVGSSLSVIGLIITFAVYVMFASLRNLHGQILMAYIACLIVAYIFSSMINQELWVKSFSKDFCIVAAYIVHFSFLSSFFWLNVMCFDIWWTFGGFRSLHGSIKQRERKKFIIYSIYAWGCASLITIIVMIMDHISGIPETYQPRFGEKRCWFDSDISRAIYFYVPMGVTVICNTCLFIVTALKILQHKKDTARQLKGSDSQRHEDHKQWFNLYLKLFIVMGITWSMEIISWILEKCGLPHYVWFITDLINTLQGVIIFIIFVWKDKIKRLLMKRFGCKGGNFLFCNSTTDDCPTSSTLRATCVTTAPLQQMSNPYVPDSTSSSRSNVTEESDCK